MLYHIVWPHGGDEHIKRRLSSYSAGTEQVLAFDRYDDLSAKGHERMRCAGKGSIDYNLTANSPLPNRDVILKNKHNKRELSRMLSLFNIGPNVALVSRDDGAFTHDEADVYMLLAAEIGKDVIRILSDDTDVFVMLVYWDWKIQVHCSMQTERWNGVVVAINATCTELGPKCLQLMGMHFLRECEIVLPL